MENIGVESQMLSFMIQQFVRDNQVPTLLLWNKCTSNIPCPLRPFLHCSARWSYLRRSSIPGREGQIMILFKMRLNQWPQKGTWYCCLRRSPPPSRGSEVSMDSMAVNTFFVTLLCLQVDLIKRFQECTQIRLTHLAIWHPWQSYNNMRQADMKQEKNKCMYLTFHQTAHVSKVAPIDGSQGEKNDIVLQQKEKNISLCDCHLKWPAQ